RYRVLDRLGHIALVEATLDTGRTHQIRVHFAHIGHPVVGDPTYGGKRLRSRELPATVREAIEALPGQALHAVSLSLRHPRTDAEMTFTAEPPPHFEALLQALRSSCQRSRS
ncbi:MAG: pseudouridine synthase, partial [Armatimonadota bacterium]